MLKKLHSFYTQSTKLLTVTDLKIWVMIHPKNGGNYCHYFFSPQHSDYCTGLNLQTAKSKTENKVTCHKETVKNWLSVTWICTVSACVQHLKCILSPAYSAKLKWQRDPNTSSHSCFRFLKWQQLLCFHFTPVSKTQVQ